MEAVGAGTRRFAELRRRGVGRRSGGQNGRQRSRPVATWRTLPRFAIALPNAYFDSLGLPPLVVRDQLNPPNRRMRTRMSGGVAGARG